MAWSIPKAIITPPGIRQAFVFWFQNCGKYSIYGGTSLCIQMPHSGASERVQMTNLQNKKAIITHK